MRNAFANTLIKLAEEDERIIFLTGDLGFQVFDEFRERFGPRFVNVGVAEAQMVCAAAGLALEGWRPIIYSIASFATARAFEQIKISVNYHSLPIVIVGGGGGYFYAASGVTHHAADDFALMSALPGMTVVAPGDPEELSQLLVQLTQLRGPSYFRIGGYGEPVYEAQEPVLLGKARLLREGEQVAVLTTGDIATEALSALESLDDYIQPLMYQFHTVKPLDTQILDSIENQVHTILVIEEHIPSGGLSAAINAWHTKNNSHVTLQRLGPTDVLSLGNVQRTELRRRFGYDAEAIAQALRNAWVCREINAEKVSCC